MMNINSADLKAWVNAQREFVKANSLSRNMVDAGDAAQFIRGLGALDALASLEGAIAEHEQRHLDGLEAQNQSAGQETSADQPSPSSDS